MSALAGCGSINATANDTTHAAFNWTSSAPLISPQPVPGQTIYGVKDPSIVYVNGKYHVFMTTAGSAGWGLAYTSFEKWSDASSATIVPLDKSPMGPGYRAAPQVFYFAPQKTWYLVYQGGDPLYSTSNDIADPKSWSAPKPFFSAAPDIVKQPQGHGWLDFWVICDDQKCYLFNTDDHGRLLRSETDLRQFPHGFHNTVAVMTEKTEDLFEASNTYRIAGTHTYVTLVEAVSPKGRYFRIWKSDSLEGKWEPFSPASMNAFASRDNVKQAWSQDISHGEMVRTNTDQTMTIDPCRPLEYLYQGNDPAVRVDDYIKLPYRLGLITAQGDNPVSALCRQPGATP
ncbi:glycoside hydrolase [Duganella radicis]|uniref:Alpha-L-arabinofuranosidase n=2 Tax=Duganella radicis TaxID=551988 RepID=A0A6L6PQX0_9BURK|nr:glycoside hydrolase [Duganella radicis]